MSAALTERVSAWAGEGQGAWFEGYRIHFYAREGRGPRLVFLHGFPSSSYDWRHLIGLLPEHAALAPDFLGFGLSQKPRERAYTLVSQADLVEALLARHAPEEAIFLVGHDIGTSVANELMARDLDSALGFELAGVFLLNGSMVQDAASPTLAQRLLRSRAGPLAARLSSERFFRRQFASIFSADHPLSDQEAADQWSLIAHEGGHRIGHLLIRYMDERLERAERWHGALRDWSGPLSLGWGLADPVATPAVLAAVRGLRPQAPVTEWPRLGHYPQLEDPRAVATALRAALGD